MARATFPTVYFDEAAGSWKAEMRDKKTGRTWGYGYGATRQEAIYNARRDKPSEKSIKRAIGWVIRHPFIVGAAVGMYLAYRRAKNHQFEMRPIDYLSAGAIGGTIVWGLSKIFTISDLVPQEVINRIQLPEKGGEAW